MVARSAQGVDWYTAGIDLLRNLRQIYPDDLRQPRDKESRDTTVGAEGGVRLAAVKSREVSWPDLIISVFKATIRLTVASKNDWTSRLSNKRDNSRPEGVLFGKQQIRLIDQDKGLLDPLATLNRIKH